MTSIDIALEEPIPEPEPPPERRLGPRDWARQNLFSTWYNALLTVVFGALLAYIAFRAGRFVFVTARWEIVDRNLRLLIVGRYPEAHLWRVWAAGYVAAGVLGFGAGVAARAAEELAVLRGGGGRVRGLAVRRLWPVALLLVVLVALTDTVLPIGLLAGVIAVGVAGYVPGRRLPSAYRRWANLAVIAGLFAAFQVVVGFGGVGWAQWGGLMLTLFLAASAIALAFPFGVLLALGRRSSFPAVRLVCVAYIELIRGVPLITVLFMGALALRFFLPQGVGTPTLISRAIFAFVVFTAAYVAEIVRGGLQSVPKGQYEAAMAVGLSPITTTRLIVLPQALRNVIPALVGQFISLFKDTSLVAIIGGLELLEVSRVITRQPDFLAQGLQAETLIFASFVYWVGAYSMSRESQRLERRLGLGER